jgi:hypothetical protein
MQLPAYTAKMLRFFELAFQQTQVSIDDFEDQAYPGRADFNPPTEPLLVQNASESFARTVLELIAEGRPLTEAVTTRRFMMTPALKELYAFLDQWQVDDAGKVDDRFKVANPTLSLTVEASQGPVPIAQTLDPTSPNYMRWYDPEVGHFPAYLAEGCAQDPIVYPAPVSGLVLHYILYGTLSGWKTTGGLPCPIHPGNAMAPQVGGTDFTDWKMVTIRPPAQGEATTAFHDLPTLRTTTELVLNVPRIGFFSTPAFFANWQTNTSNQARVTANQALIVATGMQIDAEDPTAPSTTPGLDVAHASSGVACFGCHQRLDPMRSIFSATYSWNYHLQTDPAESSVPGLFAFQGVIAPMASLSDFAQTLAGHPLFAQAWAQKLCEYANSARCDPSDPEFARVVGVFQSSGFSWSALVRELLSSPLTTNAVQTATWTTNGEVVAVSRRDHLCAALNQRLGFTDLCALDVFSGQSLGTMTEVPAIVAGLPSDGYGRGATDPVLPNAPSLFYVAGAENICEAVAGLVIDVPAANQTPNTKQWSSAQPDAAIADFLQLVMALTPSDPRYAPAQTILETHFTDAMNGGAGPTAALQSTFVAACLAPSTVSIGM